MRKPLPWSSISTLIWNISSGSSTLRVSKHYHQYHISGRTEGRKYMLKRDGQRSIWRCFNLTYLHYLFLQGPDCVSSPGLLWQLLGEKVSSASIKGPAVNEESFVSNIKHLSRKLNTRIGQGIYLNFQVF